MDISSGMYDEEYGEDGRPGDKKRKNPEEEEFKNSESGKRRKCPECGKNHPGECQKNVIKCYNCEKTGHYSRNCPELRKEIKCYNCGDEGHKKMNCPNLILNPTPLRMLSANGEELVIRK